MKSTELRKMNLSELQNLVTEQARQKFLMRIQRGMGESPKPHMIKQARQNLARLLTIISEKERQV